MAGFTTRKRLAIDIRVECQFSISIYKGYGNNHQGWVVGGERWQNVVYQLGLTWMHDTVGHNSAKKPIESVNKNFKKPT